MPLIFFGELTTYAVNLTHCQVWKGIYWSRKAGAACGVLEETVFTYFKVETSVAELGRVLAKEMNRKPSATGSPPPPQKQQEERRGTHAMVLKYTRLAELENHLPEYPR